VASEKVPMVASILPPEIYCCAEKDQYGLYDNLAADFLQKHGHSALVSLGCGRQLNRIDNHIRLMAAFRLNYYVGIDCHNYISPVSETMFTNPEETVALLKEYYNGKPKKFWASVKLFPGTFVEDLFNIHCAVVVCQRVLPGCRWENTIVSMTPEIVLQEDLHGCERQQLRGKNYFRNWSKISCFGLRPFRPWPVFPGEKNLILWRRNDVFAEEKATARFRWLRRLAESFIG